MLTLFIPAVEEWDDVKQEFVEPIPAQNLVLEHSLMSISKWESKWHKPFLDKKDKTLEEILDYIKCMTISKNVDDRVYQRLTNENINSVVAYIDDPMTATWFSDDKIMKNRRQTEIITAEIIYYWMVAFNIPFECEKWHLNRLMTLIRVCNAKQEKPKKQNKKEMMRSRAALNAARKKQLNTRG